MLRFLPYRKSKFTYCCFHSFKDLVSGCYTRFADVKVLNLKALCHTILPFLKNFAYPLFSFGLQRYKFINNRQMFFQKKPCNFLKNLPHFFETDCKDTRLIFFTKFSFEILFFLTCNFFLFNELSTFLKAGCKDRMLTFLTKFFSKLFSFYLPSNPSKNHAFL